MQNIVFDDSGEMWDAKSYRLVEMLQASLYGEELLNYAVKNLGFVVVNDSKGSLRIRVRPSVVSPMAFSGFLYWLLDRSVERVLLSILDKTGWTHEMFGDKQDAPEPPAAMLPSPTTKIERAIPAQAAPNWITCRPVLYAASPTSGRKLSTSISVSNCGASRGRH
jgi:hypothetical protein